jgi:hypothetical protein
MISHFAKTMVAKVVIPEVEVPRPKVGSKGIKEKVGELSPQRQGGGCKLGWFILSKYTILYKSIL